MWQYIFTVANALTCIIIVLKHVHLIILRLLEEGGDWECRNRLKVYRGLYYLTIRDWAKAAPLLLESTATFACTELLTLRALVMYTVIAAVLCFKRPQLHDKVHFFNHHLNFMLRKKLGPILHTSIYCTI